MNAENYLIERVDKQIEWYDKKSITCQKQYKRTQFIEIILAALIPFCAGYIDRFTWLSIVVATFGVCITILESTNKLYKFHENWLQYRSTCELLRYQKQLYITQSAPYNESEETKFNLFVRNIEQIISSENNQWKVMNTSKHLSDKSQINVSTK